MSINVLFPPHDYDDHGDDIIIMIHSINFYAILVIELSGIEFHKL